MPVLAGVYGYATVHFNSTGYGNYVDVDAGGGWIARYAHLQNITISNGPVIPRTQVGTVGNTGTSTGPHLHYEQRLNGTVQPATFNGSAVSYSYNFPGNPYTSSNCSSTAGDFTGDGKSDIAWYEQWQNKISILASSGNGFTWSTGVTGIGAPTWAASS